MQTVFLIDNNSILYDALKHVLPSKSLAVKLFNSLERFIDEHEEQTTGCLLIDNSKFNSDVISMQTDLNNAGVAIPAIFLADDIDIPTIIKAIQLKASNVIIKPFKNALLLESLQLALEADKAKQQQSEKTKNINSYYASLSKREKQVMQLMIDGASNKSMAQTLQITPKTIEAHRAKVMRKMCVNSLAQLVRVAIQYELTENCLSTEEN